MVSTGALIFHRQDLSENTKNVDLVTLTLVFDLLTENLILPISFDW
jgi:hypothetical protein